MSPSDAPPGRLRLGVVPGVNPGRWVDTWRGRRSEELELVPVAAADAEDLLLAGTLDAAFLRLPLGSPGLRRIPLWTEDTVLAVSRESELTLLKHVTPADLTDQALLVAADDVLAWVDAPGEAFVGRAPETTADALELVAHEAGVCFVPKAVARALHRRDVVLLDAPFAPTSQVGLAWLPQDEETPELVEILIGIVRGRTVNSTRGHQPTTAKPTPVSRRTTRGGGRREPRPGRRRR